MAFQRERAESAVRYLRGVKGVIRDHRQASRFSLGRQIRIQDALKRNAAVDASNISVETDGGKVILRGKVRSWAKRREAETAAWRAPGVTIWSRTM